MSTAEMKKGIEVVPPQCSRDRRLRRSERYLVGKYQEKPSSQAPGGPRKKSDLTKPISSQRVTVIVVPGKSAYRLNRPLVLKAIEERGRVRIQPVGLRQEVCLVAEGTSLQSARDDFGRRFDRWVQSNFWVPPHLQTKEQTRISRILKHLVNWDRYEKDHPLVQPMWGQVREHRADGSVLVFWLSGPNEARNRETALPSRDVSPALSEIPVNQWFYGSAKCFPNRLEWVEPPEQAPDPGDPEARTALWDSLPIEVTSEPGCWPLRTV